MNREEEIEERASEYAQYDALLTVTLMMSGADLLRVHSGQIATLQTVGTKI